jgi:hypothetical protein
MNPPVEEDIDQLREDSAMLQWLLSHVEGAVTVEIANGPHTVVSQSFNISRNNIREVMRRKP